VGDKATDQVIAEAPQGHSKPVRLTLLSHGSG
jgi:hypothetical protein